MTKKLIALIFTLIAAIAASAFVLLFPIISAELVRSGQCDSIKTVCAVAKSTGILIVVVVVPVILLIIGGVLAALIWRKTHGLVIFYKNADKDCQHQQGPANAGEGNRIFTRIKVTNRAGKAAEHCIGRLVSILNDECRGVDNWVDSKLMWDGEETEIRLVRNESRFLNVVWTRQNDSVFRVRIDVSTSHGVVWERPRGLYYFNIVISADGYDPVDQWFRATWYRQYDDWLLIGFKEVDII